MPAEIWKRRDVAARFLNEQSLSIPDRPRQLEVLLRVLSASSRPLHRVLDLGTGDGLLLATVLDAYPDTDGIGLDFSPHMLEQARQRLSSFGTRVQILEADLQTPAWQQAVSGPFDAIVSGFAIHHLTHGRKRALYREIYDLLSPGGQFLNTEHVSSPTPQVERLFDEAMTDQLYSRRRERGENVTREEVFRQFQERPDRAANILAPVEEQCQWLRELGFRDVDCFRKYFELAVFGGTK